MGKITVYCGESVQDKCGKEKHPVAYVEEANRLVTSGESFVLYSNHPDFISAIKYIGEKHGVEMEFFLNGISQGNEIDEIFGDLNRALEFINKYSE